MAPRLPTLTDIHGRPLRKAELTREIAAATTTGVRQALSGHPAQGLTPQRLARLLRSAEEGDAIAYLELAEEMEEKDPHYLAVLSTRKRQVAQLPIDVEPAGDSAEEKADAQLVKDWLDRDLLEAELFDILDAVGKGYSATELVWSLGADLWQPNVLKWRDPRYFEFDRETRETLMLRELSGPEPLPPAKFIVHYHPAKSGLPVRSGLARIAAWGYLFKNYAIKDWVAFLETYGMPMRYGRYDNGETEENIRTLMSAIADLGSDAAAVFPKSMDVQFESSADGSTPEGLWERKARYVDEQISKAVLGQTGTTDMKSGGIGDGGNAVHDRVAGDIERADAKLIAATLNRDLVVPLVMLNRGQRKRYPRIRIGRPEAIDVKALVENAVTLANNGAAIDADEVRDRAGLPAPKKDGRLLGGGGAARETGTAPTSGESDDAPKSGVGGDKIQQQALNGAQVDALKDVVTGVSNGEIAPQAAKQLVAIAFPLIDRDTVDKLVDGAAQNRDRHSGPTPPEGAPPAPSQPETPEAASLRPLSLLNRAIASEADDAAPPDAIDTAADEALEDWERLVAPMIEPIGRLVDSSESLDALKASLASSIEKMGVDAVADQLARALFGARLAGDADARGGDQQ